MKKVFLACSLLGASLATKAQGTLGKNNTQINVGVGLSSRGLPVYLGFDYGASNDITIGLEGAFRSYTNAGYTFTIFNFSGNANYHFNRILNIPRDFDFYAGLSLGYYIWNLPHDYRGPYSSGLGLSAQVGGRYFFNNKIGLNLEVGGGNTAAGGKLGLTIKL